MDHIALESQIERRRKRRRGIIALLAALAALTLGAGSFSLARFTDSDSSTWSFTTGTINIDSNLVALANVTGLMPGGSATDDLVIRNLGSADLRYAMTTVATNALGDQLNLLVKEEDVDGGCDDWDGANVLSPAQALNGAAFGDPTQGADTGDRVLVAGGSEVLCFRVSLPLSTDDTFQGATSTATFTFDAEQTANNP